MMTAPELVVLVNEAGGAIGAREKREVHDRDTPLHLAFSCYLLDARGRLLVTRRSIVKHTWPGVWTNSFCGHPAPEEELVDAVVRRARQELGAEVGEVICRLPAFRYRAIDASGIVENEICPVFTARIGGALDPDPHEVAEWEWIEPSALFPAVSAIPFAFSPWMREQLPLLMQQGNVFERRELS